MRELIRHNEYANGRLKQDGKMKVRLFNEAVKLCSEHVEITPGDFKEFGDNFRAYVLKRLREKTKNIVPHFHDNQLLDFMNFPNHLLETIEAKWRELRLVQMTPDYQNVIIPDGNQYAETPEELERLKHVRQLIAALEWIAENGNYIDFQSVARACPSVLIVTGSKSAEPCEHYILQQRF